MNRAEYEAVNNRIAALESRCELLEREIQSIKAAPLEAAVEAELNRKISQAKRAS